MALLAKGAMFSVADVADLAGVSRTTAYNYFPTLEALHAQAVVTFASQIDIPDFSERFAATGDVRERVRFVVEASDARGRQARASVSRDAARIARAAQRASRSGRTSACSG